MEDFLTIMCAVAFGCLFGVAVAEFVFWNHFHPLPTKPVEDKDEDDDEKGRRLNIYI
jgi:hypothetical protein